MDTTLAKPFPNVQSCRVVQILYGKHVKKKRFFGPVEDVPISSKIRVI